MPRPALSDAWEEVLKKNAKQRMQKRPARFVIGYMAGGNPLWGRPFGKRGNLTLADTKMTDPLNRRQAEKLLEEMPCADAAIFELVPVKVNR
jgi:hypothetical protein